MLPDKRYMILPGLVSIKPLPDGACCNPMQEGCLRRAHPPIAGTVPVLPVKGKKYRGVFYLRSFLILTATSMAIPSAPITTTTGRDDLVVEGVGIGV